jgi:hypothetical protein
MRKGSGMTTPTIPTVVTATIGTKPRRKRKPTVGLPYASATSGIRAQEEAKKWLRRLGCERIGFMDDFQTQELLLAFSHRGRLVQLRASAKGWAQAWLKQNPQGYRSRTSPDEYKRAALHQGQIAVSSILRDWVKGSVMAVESGILSFEAVFMPFARSVACANRGEGRLITVGDRRVTADPRNAHTRRSHRRLSMNLQTPTVASG